MQRIISTTLLIICGILFFETVKAQDEDIIFQEKNYIFPYDLSNPDTLITLPSKLIEISGISYMEGERFACVQDEKGNIYILNFKTAEIERKIDFADDGDFEGIDLVGNTAWVLKSNGNLYRVKDFLNEKTELKVKKFETKLSKKNDTEGLAWDPEYNRLLIASKGNPYYDEKKDKHKKSIFAFDLELKKLKSNPAYLIDLEQIKQFRDYNTMTHIGIDLLSVFDESKGDVTFQPSDLAVHPISGYIYVIGAVGDLLIILNRFGIPVAMVDLDDKLYKQPEGICFDKNGVLYISNEGLDSKATILKFSMKK